MEVVETCTVARPMAMKIMLLKISEDVCPERKRLIYDYFESEKGAESSNDVIVEIMGMEQSRVKIFKNTDKESLLYPLLFREAIIELDYHLKLGNYKKNEVKRELVEFMVWRVFWGIPKMDISLYLRPSKNGEILYYKYKYNGKVYRRSYGVRMEREELNDSLKKVLCYPIETKIRYEILRKKKYTDMDIGDVDF